MATPLLLMSTNEPNSTRTRSQTKSEPNQPRPRGRKPGKSGPPRIKQRGMGVAQLEYLRQQSEQQQPQPQPQQQQQLSSNNNSHVTNPLSGVPVQHPPGLSHYVFPVRDPRSALRVTTTTKDELPSMPNHYQQQQQQQMLDHSTLLSTLSYKKKRVVGEDVGFLRGTKERYGVDDHHIVMPSSHGCNFVGFDLINNNNNGVNNINHQYFAHVNGGFSGYYATDTEIVAIHQKGNGARNVMKEYGFFPGKPEPNQECNLLDNGSRSSSITYDYNNNNNNHRNNNNNNNIVDNNDMNCSYYKMEDLNLKMGLSTDPSSPSPCSSLSSLSSATTTGPSSTSLDLSLKLSY